MSECKTNTCHDKEQCCTEEKSSCNKTCPIEGAVDMWNASFFQAMRETQVELLKGKIKKTWGPVLEKEADAVLAAMGTCWETTIKKAKAECDLRETFKKIYSEAQS